MNIDEAGEWLHDQWQRILNDPDGEIDPLIDRFVNARVTSIRFAIVTQLLGKIADPRRDLLCLQKGQTRVGDAVAPERWDPRSFCVRAVVPWNRENEQVLGGSGDPYVNNPLRRPRLDEGLENVHAGTRDDWIALAEYFRRLQQEDEDAVKLSFGRCLRSVAARLARQRFDYPTPNRTSLDQLCELLDRYLATPSGGLRPQAVTTALMRVLGSAFSIFSRVDGQGVNEADRARNVPGDVMCFGVGPDGQEEIRLVVDAKSDRLRLTELQGSVAKARTGNVSNFLFATPGFREDEQPAMERIIGEEFVQGLNVYVISIGRLARTSCMLLAEAHRTEFMQEVGRELDSRAASLAHRRAWSDLLSNLGRGGHG